MLSIKVPQPQPALRWSVPNRLQHCWYAVLTCTHRTAMHHSAVNWITISLQLLYVQSLCVACNVCHNMTNLSCSLPVRVRSCTVILYGLQGYGVLAGSCVRSVPQILRMNKNKRCSSLAADTRVAGPAFVLCGHHYNHRRLGFLCFPGWGKCQNPMIFAQQYVPSQAQCSCPWSYCRRLKNWQIASML